MLKKFFGLRENNFFKDYSFLLSEAKFGNMERVSKQNMEGVSKY